MVKIVSLVENTSKCGCATAHGLSLYIETARHRVLFDLGADHTFIDNAQLLGIDLSMVDIVIISHGHRDHGGALALALELNDYLKVYIQRQAFEPHFSHRPSGVSNIGLDRELMDHERVTLLDGDFDIDDELTLFKVSDNSLSPSGANATLYEGDRVDNFCHEQNLIIRGEEPILIMGCGHNGVVNIMNRAREFAPRLCVGGFHLTNPSARRDEPRELIDSIINQLEEFAHVEFYTCHCTGVAVYQYMRERMPNIYYLSSGQSIEVGRDLRVTTLLDEVSTSWDGATLESYPEGRPKFTMQRIVIPPKSRLPRHSHTIMNLGYILEGELTITTDDGESVTFTAAEPAIECVGQLHYGENRGEKNAVVLVITIL